MAPHLLLQLGHAAIHGRSTSLSQPLHMISKPPSHRLLREALGLGSTGRTVLNMAIAASEAAALHTVSTHESRFLRTKNGANCSPAAGIDCLVSLQLEERVGGLLVVSRVKRRERDEGGHVVGPEHVLVHAQNVTKIQ